MSYFNGGTCPYMVEYKQKFSKSSLVKTNAGKIKIKEVILMAEDYPYMISNNKIAPILKNIMQAGKPKKFSHVFLKNLGYTSSNDRAIIPLLKRLGFLLEDGAPTEYYDKLRDATKSAYVLGERIRALYSELYSINTKIHEASEKAIKGAISRVTGKDAKSVGRYYATFKALTAIAKFVPPKIKEKEEKPKIEEEGAKKMPAVKPPVREAGFYYNIQIHLPATTDISVYNAIFKSLKENLGI